MTIKEILEYNKRCAEFLGWVKYNGRNLAWDYSYDTNEIHFGGKTVHLRYMKFHSDWNWIMEIVEAIEEKGYFVMINKWTSVYTGKEKEGERIQITTVEGKYKLVNTVQAITQFLIWYNKNK